MFFFALKKVFSRHKTKRVLPLLVIANGKIDRKLEHGVQNDKNILTGTFDIVVVVEKKIQEVV